MEPEVVAAFEGGMAGKKGFTEKDADKKQLKMGIAVEHEHSNSGEIAKHIALDHLAEFPTYYTALKKMEDSLQKKANQVVDETTPSLMKNKKPIVIEARNKIGDINSIMKFIAAPNKMQVIERSVVGLVTRPITNAMRDTMVKKSSIAAFNDELNKLLS